MKLPSKLSTLVASAILVCSLTATSWANPTGISGDLGVPNIGVAKKLCKEYYNSGRHAEDVRNVAKDAKAYLDDVLAKPHSDKLAMVLDIDETSLSNAPHIMAFDYGYLPEEWTKWVLSGKAPAIEGTLELYKYALEKGVTVFFMTGRHENEREATIKNLHEQGYAKFAALITKPDGSSITSKEFKTLQRKQIIESGYRIVINMGDQMSDLEGGYAEATFKLPNPMYFVP